MKICTKCKTERDIGCYNKSSTRKSGLYPICKQCKKIYAKLYREKNKEILKKKKAERYESNKDEISIKNKLYRDDNKEKIKVTNARYYEDNKVNITQKQKAYTRTNRDIKKIYDTGYREVNKLKISLYKKEWKQNNKLRCRASHAKRRGAKLKRTPSWSNLEEIRDFYQNCPDGFHVDHIIPLQGKEVSGLHVLSNLQYLIASDNISKGNKMLEEYRIIIGTYNGKDAKTSK